MYASHLVQLVRNLLWRNLGAIAYDSVIASELAGERGKNGGKEDEVD